MTTEDKQGNLRLESINPETSSIDELPRLYINPKCDACLENTKVLVILLNVVKQASKVGYIWAQEALRKLSK